MAIPPLTQRTCKPCEGGVAPMGEKEIASSLSQVKGWAYKNNEICKTFKFKNYYENIAFVNAVAWISHRENHHPTLEVRFRECTVHYNTHAISGLSENDFICAAKVDALQG